MALTTPTTAEINTLIIAQLEATLNQTIPLLPKSFLRVLAKVIAAVFTLLYKYGGFIFLQLFVQTATIKTSTVAGTPISPLTLWGELIGVGPRAAATNAQLLIEITVDNQTGTLPANTQLIGDPNGVTYLTLTAVTLDAPTKQVEVLAVSDQSGGSGAGTIGNLDAGQTLSFANPLPNVARQAAVVSQTITAANEEDVEVYRQRILDRFQKPPQGGAYSDYEIWGEEVQGIINVYPYTSDCPGQVDVYAEATPASSGSLDGIPTLAQLQDVQDSIQLDQNGLASRRPAGALVNVYAITRVGFDVTVSGIADTPDVAQTQVDVETALNEYFVAREPFIPGLSVPPRRDRVTETEVGGIVADIVSAGGGIFVGAAVELNGFNVPIYTLGEGEKAKLLSVTFV